MAIGHSVSLVATAVTHQCGVCAAVLQSKDELMSHNAANHQQSTSLPANEVATDSTLTGFPCEVCGKVLKSRRNLDNHLKKVHGQSILISDNSTG